jgi:hypothetical protein
VARKQWRCFFCDEVFMRSQDAAEHFGFTDGDGGYEVPACKITAHEGHLVHYIRKLQAQVRDYETQNDDVMRSIMTLEAEHQTALRREEEKGYERGLRDGRTLAA